MNLVSKSTLNNANLANVLTVATLAAPALGVSKYYLVLKFAGLSGAAKLLVTEEYIAGTFANAEVSAPGATLMIEVDVTVPAGDPSVVIKATDSTDTSTNATVTIEIYDVSGTSGGDWTDGEKAQIRQAIGLTGAKAATDPTGELQMARRTSFLALMRDFGITQKSDLLAYADLLDG